MSDPVNVSYYEGFTVHMGTTGRARNVSTPRSSPIVDAVLGFIIQEGIATIRQILAERPGTKIIAISGGGRIGNTDFLQIARKMGAVDALQKPFDPDDLLGRINNCLKAA